MRAYGGANGRISIAVVDVYSWDYGRAVGHQHRDASVAYGNRGAQFDIAAYGQRTAAADPDGQRGHEPICCHGG